MPDISMCLNSLCPVRQICYRYRATPNEYHQSYAHFNAEKCDAFYPIPEGRACLVDESAADARNKRLACIK